jgi:hypothetical protein
LALMEVWHWTLVDQRTGELREAVLLLDKVLAEHLTTPSDALPDLPTASH